MKQNTLILLIAVALACQANAHPYSNVPEGSLQVDEYHYKKSSSDSFSELNQETVPFEANAKIDFSGSANEINQLQGFNSGSGQDSAKHNSKESGYYYEKKMAGNPFLNGQQQSGCSSSSCTASASFDLKKGNVNIQAKDQRNHITVSAQRNPFLNQASASASASASSGSNSQLPQAPIFPAPQPNRPISVNVGKDNPFLKPGSGSAVLTPISVQTNQQTDQVSGFPDQFSSGPGSYDFPSSQEQFTQQSFETDGGLTFSCAGQNKICVAKNLCVNGYTSQQGLSAINSQNQQCNLNFEVCCTLKTQVNEIKTSRPVPEKTNHFSSGNKANAIAGSSQTTLGFPSGGLFGESHGKVEDLSTSDLTTGGKGASESNGYLPPLGSEPSSNIPAFSQPPQEPELEGEANDASPTGIRPQSTFPPAPEIPPQLGCAAALICVEEKFCTMDAVISPEPVTLTSEQLLRRAPMSSCKNPDNGIIGKCCRDPNYVDPWPTGNLPANYTGGFDEMGFPTFLNIAQTRPQKGTKTPAKTQQPIRPQQPIKSQQPIQPQQPFTQQPIRPQQPLTQQPIRPQQPFTQPPIRPQQSFTQQPIHPQQPFTQQPIRPQQPFTQQPIRPQQPFTQQTIHPQQPIQPEQPIRPEQPFITEKPIQTQQPIRTQQPFTQQPIHPQQPFTQQPIHPQPTQPEQTIESQPPFHSQQSSDSAEAIQSLQPIRSQQPVKTQQPTKTYQPTKTQQPTKTYQNVKTSHPVKTAPPSKTFNFSNSPSIPSGQQISDAISNFVPNFPVKPPSQGSFLDNFPGLPSVSLPNFPNFPNPFNQNQQSKNSYDSQSTNEKPIIINPHTPGLQCGLRNQVQRPSSLSDVDVAFGEIPWQAMILSGRDRKLLCSGVIVSPNVVLTAAHCVDGLNPVDVAIKSGEWKLGYELKHEEPLPFEIVQVVSIVPHPGYSSGKPSYDTALLFLEHPVALDQHVDTICLGDSIAINPGRKCIATGWGKTVLQVNNAGALMHSINVDLLNQNECRQRLEGAESQLDLDDSLVCVKAQKVSNNMCQVDVGGPLACDRGDGFYELTGIYSQETGCLPTNQVATFAVIDSYWVKETIKSPPLVKIEQTFTGYPSTSYPKPVTPIVPAPQPFQPQSVQPVQPIRQPAQFIQEPILPSSQPKPISQPAQSTAHPFQPIRQPVQPILPITQPAQPIQPLRQPAQPIQPITQPAQPIQPLRQPAFLTSQTSEPFPKYGPPISSQTSEPFPKYGPPVSKSTQPIRPVNPITPIKLPSSPVAPIVESSIHSQSENQPQAFVQQPSGFQHSHGLGETCDCRQSKLPSENNQYLPPAL